MIKCGMCEVDITPPLGSYLPGHFHIRLSSGVKDPLYVKSLVVECDGELAVILAVDSVSLSRRMVEEIRTRLHEEIGIEAERVFVSATHTHTGGPVSYGFSDGKPDEGYLQWLARKAGDCALMAYRGRREAMIGFGRGEEGSISFNRRYFMKSGEVRTNPGIGNPNVDRVAGVIDPEVLVMRIDDAEGNPIGVLTNFACHTDTAGGTEYSADFPGELSRFVKRSLGEETVSLFILGACGDINHVDVSGKRPLTPGHYLWMGRVLGAEVLKVREKIVASPVTVLASASEKFKVNLRKPTAEAIAEAYRLLESASSDQSPMELAFAAEMVKMDKTAELGEEQDALIEVQALRIGELAIAGFPGEMFVAFGLEVKGNSPFAYTMIDTLCNDVHGYICTKEAYLQGGYEPRIHTRNRLAEDAGARMTQTALKLLGQLNH